MAISQPIDIRAVDNQRDEMSAGDQMADNRDAVRPRNIDIEMPVRRRLPAFNVNRINLQARLIKREINKVIPTINIDDEFKGMESKQHKL